MKDENKHSFIVGKWAFLAGLILAIISGFLMIPALAVVLFILGLTVGFFKINKQDMTSYLVAIVALLLASQSILVLQPFLGSWIIGTLKGVLINFNSFLAASGLVIAIRAVLLIGTK